MSSSNFRILGRLRWILNTSKSIYICTVKRSRVIAFALLGAFILSSVGLYGVSYYKLDNGKVHIELADTTIQFNPLCQGNAKEFRGSSSLSLQQELPAVQKYFVGRFTQSQTVIRKVRNLQFVTYCQHTLSYKADLEYFISFRSLII